LKLDHFDNGVFNVLTSNATVEEIVNIIRSSVPNLQIEYVDSPIMNQLSYTVACERFKSLGFQFEGSLQEGIRETLLLIRNLDPGTELAN